MSERVDEVSNYENDISIYRMAAGSNRAQGKVKTSWLHRASNCTPTRLDIQALGNVACCGSCDYVRSPFKWLPFQQKVMDRGDANIFKEGNASRKVVGLNLGAAQRFYFKTTLQMHNDPAV